MVGLVRRVYVQLAHSVRLYSALHLYTRSEIPLNTTGHMQSPGVGILNSNWFLQAKCLDFSSVNIHSAKQILGSVGGCEAETAIKIALFMKVGIPGLISEVFCDESMLVNDLECSEKTKKKNKTRCRNLTVLRRVRYWMQVQMLKLLNEVDKSWELCRRALGWRELERAAIC